MHGTSFLYKICIQFVEMATFQEFCIMYIYLFFTVEQFFCVGLGPICCLLRLDSCLQTFMLHVMYVYHKHNMK